mgnify:CR=1 FL=1
MQAMDRFNESFDGEIKIPSTSIPQILYSGYRIVKDKKSFSRLAEKVSNLLQLMILMRNINSMSRVVQVAKRMSKDVLIIGVEL